MNNEIVDKATERLIIIFRTSYWKHPSAAPISIENLLNLTSTSQKLATAVMP